MTEVKLLRVFVASPADVLPERDALAEVIKNVNTTLAGLEPVQLKLLRWEEDVEPAVGKDPQAIVNSQIGTDYEVFVGILWKHFGTPTPRADSGTLEEFQRAIEYHQQQPDSVSVMFYFKNASVPIDVNTQQLARVQEFRRRFPEIGLCGTFTDTRDFASKLQIRLTRTALKWSREGTAPHPSRVVEVPQDPASEDGPKSENNSSAMGHDAHGPEDDDAGFLDLVEEGTAGFQQVTAVSGRMTRQIETLGGDIQRSTSELNAARDGSGDINAAKAKSAINLLASSMVRFAGDLEAEVEPFRDGFGRAIRAYARAAMLLGDFDGDVGSQLSNARETTARLEQSMAESQTALREFRSIINRQPRTTTYYNRARKRVLEVLDALDKEMASARSSARETLELFEELMQRFSQD